jgi:predicted outer membrane protein
VSQNPHDDRAAVDRDEARCRRSPLAFRLTVALGTWILVTLGVASPATAHIGEKTAGYLTAASAATEPPLTAADRDLLTKVRLAGLWERPAGNMAAQKGVSRRVREVGTLISSQHKELDAIVVKAAKQVDLPLPDVPTAEQQGWLDEMSQASGAQFDQVFVSRLRVAHGKVFPVIANVRAGTRNTVVRKLAQSANDYVLTHLTLLESTDLVNYSSLPLPPQPAAAAAPAGQSQPAGRKVAATENLASPSSTNGILVPVLLMLSVPLLLLLRKPLGRAMGRPREQRYDPPPQYERYERYEPYETYEPYEPYDSYESSTTRLPSYAQGPPYQQTSYDESADRPRRLQTRSRLRP